MITLQEDYRERPVRYLNLWTFEGWKMKVYTISYQEKAVDERLINAAAQKAERLLREKGNDTHHYGVGFIGIHQGRESNFVFIDWWADENELRHHVYTSGVTRPEQLQYRTPEGISACVWDLALIGFERDAWVSLVLNNQPGPDLTAYLQRRLNTYL